MRKKIIFGFILIAILLSVGIYIDSDNNGSILAYLNSGGVVEQTGGTVIQDAPIPIWSAGANMPAPTRYHGAAVGYVAQNGNVKLICLGGDADGSGNNSNVVSIYNVTTNSWSTGANCPPTLVFYCTASRIGDIAYLIGGIGPGGAFTSEVNEVKRYNIATNTWLTNAANYPITIASGGQGSASYQDSLIYVVGGLGNGTNMAVDSVYLFNVNTNIWRSCTKLPVGLYGGACAISGDTIVYACGAAGASVPAVNTVYKGLINQTNRSQIIWTTGQPYPGASRIRMGGASWGCKGIIVGIGSASGFGIGTDVQVYSPGANIWTVQPQYPLATSATFFASASSPGSVWRLMIASGLSLSPPYSIPQTNVMRDTFCYGINWPVTIRCKSNGLNKPIPDLSTTRDTLILNMAGCIIDLNVRIDTVFHTFDNDLSFTLTHGGTSVALITNRGGSGDNFIQTVLNDSASVPISSGTAPFTGSFRPEETLAAYNGQFLTGNWILTIVDGVGGDSGYLKTWCLVFLYSSCGGGIHSIEIPFTYRLEQNYPNPFNPTTIIKYGLPKPGNTKLVVYDILGKEVMTLVNEYKVSGTYQINFDGTNLASGVYFYSLESGNYKETKKMLLIK